MSLPSLEAPEPGTVCPLCGQLMDLIGFCGDCYEREAWEAAEARERGSHD